MDFPQPFFRRLAQIGQKVCAANRTFWNAVQLAQDIERYRGMNADQIAAHGMAGGSYVRHLYDLKHIASPAMRPNQENTDMPDQTTSWDLTPLILDFVEWVAREPRPYPDVMEAWKTSCPRLTVWEESIERGLVERVFEKGKGTTIAATATGMALLIEHDRPVADFAEEFPQAAE